MFAIPPHHWKNLSVWLELSSFSKYGPLMNSNLFHMDERGYIGLTQIIGRLKLPDDVVIGQPLLPCVVLYVLPMMRVYIWLHMHSHVIKLCLVSTQRVLVQVIGSAKKGGQVQQLSVPRVQQVTQQVHSTVHICTVHLLLSWQLHIWHFVC